MESEKTIDQLKAEINMLERSYYVTLARIEEATRAELEMQLDELKRLRDRGLKLAGTGVTVAQLYGVEFIA